MSPLFLHATFGGLLPGLIPARISLDLVALYAAVTVFGFFIGEGALAPLACSGYIGFFLLPAIAFGWGVGLFLRRFFAQNPVTEGPA